MTDQITLILKGLDSRAYARQARCHLILNATAANSFGHPDEDCVRSLTKKKRYRRHLGLTISVRSVNSAEN
jgi:hypothetical protein